MEIVGPTRRRTHDGLYDDALRYASFHQFIELVSQISRNGRWQEDNSSKELISGVTLAHRAARTLLWSLITEDTLLFQAVVFACGTYSNTCGIPTNKLQMGPAAAVTRGAAMSSLRDAAMRRDRGYSSYKTAAVALLAGWEKKYGDPEFYGAHMQMWRSLPAMPNDALDEKYVVCLLEMTLESLREGLNEQTVREQSSIEKFFMSDTLQPLSIPTGLIHVFDNEWPEAQSLASIVSRLTYFSPEADDGVARIRKLMIESINWSPTHTYGVIPDPDIENAMDQLLLNLLYHVRAACVSVAGVLLRITSDFHQVMWVAPIEGALEAHTYSCHHLRTGELMVQEKRWVDEVALWVRWQLAIGGRDPWSDDMLRHLLEKLSLEKCEMLEGMLEGKFGLRREFLGKSRGLWEILMGGAD